MHISLKFLLLSTVVCLGSLHAMPDSPQAKRFESLFRRSQEGDCIVGRAKKAAVKQEIQDGFVALSEQQEDPFTRGRALTWRAAHATNEEREKYLQTIVECEGLPAEFRIAAEGNIIEPHCFSEKQEEYGKAANDLANLLEKLQSEMLYPELSPESHMWDILVQLVDMHPNLEDGLFKEHPSLFELPSRSGTPVY